MGWVYRPEFLQKAHEILGEFPALCILGPRQCGKTTLARRGWPDWEYIDLELPSDFDKLNADPELYLSTRKRPLIIDEAQRYPEMFPILRALIDRNRKTNGYFILLGSASFRLVSGINESLSGRVGFLDLSPLLISEASSSLLDVDSHWLKGGFPDALLGGDPQKLSFDWFDHYARTLIDRDLPALGIDVTPLQFRRLWHMCAHVHGSLLNMNKAAESLGASPHTVKRYLDILEQSFLVRRLPPFFANMKKRLVKSPKLYIRDSGILHYFLRIMTPDDLVVSPERGRSFEGYVVGQLLDLCRLRSPQYEGFFFRTSDQHEVDLVLVTGTRRILVEVKAGLSVGDREVSRLQRCAELLKASRSYVVTYGADRYPLAQDIECIGIKSWAENGFPSFWLEPSTDPSSERAL
ncbi:MAG: hypothetical protein A2289_09195 [Deltaproteobacteria bacterium RIFOXYA12_FULL_58_15]|nr:MAG: hypothetical protein A2289_09195 [Deltaproteobacteria bacterium RIFOXYA12_FULL_58_15]OGR14575.1 MAG: hypothetical protein A2341_04950 [Deltaproteobacteria bacterium RIFOXYB12_FULL_58_9]